MVAGFWPTSYDFGFDESVKIENVEPILESIDLTKEEIDLLQTLALAFNKFLHLPNRSEDDNSEYRDAIHRCQQLIALRVARRINPEIWNQIKDGL